MNLHNSLTVLLVCGAVTAVRDYYVGWFNTDDILVAQDIVFKDKVFYRKVTAFYSKTLSCPISYYRVQDRLGAYIGPAIKVIRGGLRKHFISLLITSAYNLPVSVNVYIACQNKLGTGAMFTRQPWTRKKTEATSDGLTGQTTKTATGTPANANTGKAETGDDAHAPTEATTASGDKHEEHEETEGEKKGDPSAQ